MSRSQGALLACGLRLQPSRERRIQNARRRLGVPVERRYSSG